MHQRFVGSALLLERYPQIRLGFGVVGIDADGPPKQVGRFLAVSLPAQN